MGANSVVYAQGPALESNEDHRRNITVDKLRGDVLISEVGLQPSQHSSPKGSWWKPSTRNAEQKLLLKLDIYIMSWACYGYFIRLLDSSNISKCLLLLPHLQSSKADVS